MKDEKEITIKPSKDNQILQGNVSSQNKDAEIDLGPVISRGSKDKNQISIQITRQDKSMKDSFFTLESQRPLSQSEITRIVIEKTGNDKSISEIKVNYNNLNKGDISIKLQDEDLNNINNKSSGNNFENYFNSNTKIVKIDKGSVSFKQQQPKEKKKKKKDKSKLNMYDDPQVVKNSSSGKLIKEDNLSKNGNNELNKNLSKSRYDRYGNLIVKNGNQKIFFSKEIQVIKIPSFKKENYRLMNQTSFKKTSKCCKCCECIIF